MSEEFLSASWRWSRCLASAIRYQRTITANEHLMWSEAGWIVVSRAWSIRLHHVGVFAQNHTKRKNWRNHYYLQWSRLTCNQWRRQRSKGARSFRSSEVKRSEVKILQPVTRMHFFTQKKLTTFSVVAFKTQAAKAVSPSK